MLSFPPNDGAGYQIMCEGFMPYNTAEGQITLDMYSTHEELNLERVELLDPLEYTDQYYPNKYGIIFKEKVYVGEQTSASFHFRLRCMEGEEEKEYTEKRRIHLELLDNEKVVGTWFGFN